MNMNDYFGEIGVWPRGSHKIGLRYALGFVLSLLLTLGAYLLVTRHALAPVWLLVSVVVLAIVQLVVQLIYFLHVGSAFSMRTRLIALGFALVIVAILIIGSLWIMYNLNQRMMPSTAQMQDYMNDQDGF